jgi:hypothetical protein
MSKISDMKAYMGQSIRNPCLVTTYAEMLQTYVSMIKHEICPDMRRGTPQRVANILQKLSYIKVSWCMHLMGRRR